MNYFRNILNIDKLNDDTTIYGINGSNISVFINNLINKYNRDIILVSNTIFETGKIFDQIQYDDSYLFLMDDFLTSVAITCSPEYKIMRINVLKSLIQKDTPKIVVTNMLGYLKFLPRKENLVANIKNIKVGDIINREELISYLVQNGYTRDVMVDKTSLFSVRGYIIDIFIINEDNPVRLEFFDDEISSIRYFDVDSQKSLSSIDEITIYPYTEEILENNNSLLDYLNDPITIYIDYNQILNSYNFLQRQIFDYNVSVGEDNKKYMFDIDEVKDKTTLYIETLENKPTTDNYISFNTSTVDNYKLDFELLNKDIKKFLSEDKTIIICLLDKIQYDELVLNIEEKTVLTNINQIIDFKVNIIYYDIIGSFITDDTVIISHNDIFNTNKTVNKNVKNNFKYSKRIKDISKLKVSDYVVHYVNGIGIYEGLITLTKNGIKKDYLSIRYKNDDKLYLPVEKIENIRKYSSNEGKIPVLNKLDGKDFAKTKRELRTKVHSIAAELIQLYKKRETEKGYAFSKDTDLQKQFEDDFPYTLTLDQEKSVNEIKKDMESIIPMDRLLCGDVGFGKTEVAFRVMFKAVMDSKQVCYLCPTTILSNQQYKNAIKRFSKYGVRVELLNRFITAKKATDIKKGLKEGLVDIVIGTHKLLSKDIIYKDLGLLIVDEEQRFGVSHKEAIRQIKTNVDTLSLSATPIPRTLQMSLSNIRGLSLIETPPTNRFPVLTYVLAYNEAVLKDAIYKELSRGGQVFILYNKVESIFTHVNKIKSLIKDARVTFAHGQMAKSELEDTMISFVNHEYDILVCTTIIETGIDIPNVNTLIIMDADRFGLSQLYQIRGRVGRSDRIAYAYLFYHQNKILSEIAYKRLNAIKEFTELGSGLQIALRDLSIRGAGNILGSEQSGFIDTIGVELYLKILNEEIQKIDGTYEEEEEVNDKVLISVDTHISDKYAVEEEAKIKVHRLINTIETYEDIVKVSNEIDDRFGKVDDNLRIYMYEEWFSKMSLKLNLKNVIQTNNFIEIKFDKETSNKLDKQSLFYDSYQISKNFKLSYNNDLVSVTLNIINLEKHFIYYLTELLDSIIKKIEV